MSGEFPDCLKQANVSSIFKISDPLDKRNHRPVIISLLSKVYEKLLYNKLLGHVENIFNVILCDFWKTHSTHTALFKLLQAPKRIKWKGYGLGKGIAKEFIAQSFAGQIECVYYW